MPRRWRRRESVGACFWTTKNDICVIWNKKLYLRHTKYLNGVKNGAVLTERFSV